MEGRVVVVTGAAGGIGRALVELLAADGDRVVAVDLPGTDVVRLAEDLGPRHVGLTCDVSNEAEITALFAEIDRRFGRVDVLINNAAMGPTMAPTIDTTLEAFRRAVGVNLIGPFVLAREAARRMRPGGAIVNTASLAGVLGNPRRNAYAASKAGLISLTKSLACEWAALGIRVNAVAPGYVRTPMVAELERLGKADLAAVRRRVPMGRIGRPDEIAEALRFLASDRARYVTGAVLAVDGGWASFNQPGDAHPPAEAVPTEELERPDYSQRNRIVVITGAGRGIGEAMARAFAANGDTVVVIDQDGQRAAAVAASLGAPHVGFAMDVTSEERVVETFAGIRARFGNIDLLVNNAAIADAFKPAFAQSPADLEAVLDVNLAGSFLCAREGLKAMEPGAMILNVGSINTFLPFSPRHAYGASKAGVDILTRCMAAELGPQGIRTATVAPGYVRTPGVAELEAAGRIDTDAIRRRIPLGDMGRPEDVADAALFLGSRAASYINGAILYVDGGWTSFGNAGPASDSTIPEASRNSLE
ncbi:SDR family oxidoreductase [Nitratireductor mangrovi]|uniref:SDR family oxidoreductase n=1 Tax=Nitratireductor mangrovi TaxID=2599600 RepID=A0A5B8KXL9_9HYPH|nr:SDR family oxidoreductase [Nitratireductor mangrovi]QDZ00363.1 SDR family oxidoreductase [Nitratireductor mangrovi]